MVLYLGHFFAPYRHLSGGVYLFLKRSGSLGRIRNRESLCGRGCPLRITICLSDRTCRSRSGAPEATFSLARLFPLGQIQCPEPGINPSQPTIAERSNRSPKATRLRTAAPARSGRKGRAEWRCPPPHKPDPRHSLFRVSLLAARSKRPLSGLI